MRFPGAVNHPHSATGDLVENLVIADGPIPVPGFYGCERFLERVRFRGDGFVIESAEEKAI